MYINYAHSDYAVEAIFGLNMESSNKTDTEERTKTKLRNPKHKCVLLLPVACCAHTILRTHFHKEVFIIGVVWRPVQEYCVSISSFIPSMINYGVYVCTCVCAACSAHKTQKIQLNCDYCVLFFEN